MRTFEAGIEATVFVKAGERELLLKAATSENTRRSYRSHIRQFIKAGFALPATEESVARYLEKQAAVHSPRTLESHLTALSQWHLTQKKPDPTTTPLIKKLIKGIRRLKGKPKKQALPLLRSELEKIVGYLVCDASKQRPLAALRDQALMLIGFYGALRRSELVGLTWDSVEWVKDGIVLHLTQAKTDNKREGQRCIIPFAQKGAVACPVQALLAWRTASSDTGDTGSIFRRISKTGTLSQQPISAGYVNQIIKTLAKAAKLPHPERYSAHSLRRGCATESARCGASLPAIQSHGRWRSTRTVVQYIEAGRQFDDSAVNVLLK